MQVLVSAAKLKNGKGLHHSQILVLLDLSIFYGIKLSSLGI